MDKTCKTCKHRLITTQVCALISSADDEAPAYVADEYRCYSTALYIKDDFGCNLHEEKVDT